MNLYDLLASRFPADRTRACFILSDGTEISYGALEAGVGRIAALLKDKGVAVGDRVALQAAKSAEGVMVYLAALKIGAVFLPLNQAYTPSEVDYFLKDAEPKVFITDPVAFAAEAAEWAPVTETTAREDGDLAAIIYTSGTTGRSKGAMLSHGNLAANALALHQAWGFSPDDVLLHALPIFHVHGLFVALHCAFLSGCPMVWLAKFDDAEVLAGLKRSSVMMGVPTFYTRLLAAPGFTREAAAHMRLFVCGSAPLLESTFAEFEARTGQRILERYGMSEAVIITSNPLGGDRIAGSVGFPLPGVELRIRGGEATGVIEIRGPSVFGGYWRMPEKTAEEFTADGFFITGDVGRQDADGRVWISGRAKDLIISGGYNVYPKEVELVLDEMAGVTESAVVGVPHPDFGEAVVAVVIGQGDEAAMIAAAREQLAAFKTPKRVFFVDDLPRNAMGKVQKNLLRERFGGTFV
ncbi:AMP-binding protein [Phenylobacterium aquaticum]|uniref:AMP-binding protein n=1 Tax=Phenylobacterium aquaticum TaxID=1763816 RepID=UPI001F5CD98D|nr:AMP-binding protein [Phenylobacterium aquaticum]MCI3134837.1 AMP-binding protein [Phenylobacterium aquaticum]